jgi:NAD(P)-dependent dehydrogenase (short-subunit alcohol dehydrogenase family)
MTQSQYAVVTGAAQGIGLAISEALLNAGYQVFALDINARALAKAREELRVDDRYRPMVVDLSQAEAVADIFKEIDSEVAGLDVLVNNAGTCLLADFVEISPADFKRQMAVNFDSAFYCCQQAIPRMQGRPGIKKIVNISSNGAYNFDVFDPAHYRASKAAMDNLTKHLARRYAKEGIVVNSIAPAMTQTDLFEVVPPEVLAEAIAAMPRGQAMQPEQIAAWVAFLVSDAGACSSGNVIILNQGRDVR